MVKIRKHFSLQVHLICNLFILNVSKMGKEMELHPLNGLVYYVVRGVINSLPISTKTTLNKVIQTVLLGNNTLMKTY